VQWLRQQQQLLPPKQASSLAAVVSSRAGATQSIKSQQWLVPETAMQVLAAGEVPFRIDLDLILLYQQVSGCCLFS
jgi:hypothetical protein